ncbi:ClpX C4-type zinc finger protein [Streptacidiphilus carbonis]|jgi:hypothetical protein|uniref:ClpX C4-type zinc finger protein n=1 Tax=Streptacidiphilus carbonis TaxID=105422 RepID=UPI0005A65C0C|nr:ClpX C4-type zinc finger protein [Streptacidiphilus carbonis]
MPTTAPSPTEVHCSFCVKPAPAVAKIIAGPGVYICNECVSLCNDILGQEAAAGPASSEVPDWEDMTDEQILERLPRIAAVGAQVDGSLRLLVDRLRERGVSWARIGTALSMTRQSAWERYAPQREQ